MYVSASPSQLLYERYFVVPRIIFWLTASLLTKFSIRDFFCICDQIRSFLRIWSDLLKKSLMENFIFCAVLVTNIRKKIFSCMKYICVISHRNVWARRYLRCASLMFMEVCRSVVIIIKHYSARRILWIHIADVVLNNILESLAFPGDMMKQCTSIKHKLWSIGRMYVLLRS